MKESLKSRDIIVQCGEEKVDSINEYLRSMGNTIPRKKTYIKIQNGN